MTRSRSLFITGTDTGVGKTRVGCAIAREMRRRGRSVGVLKPAETGVGPEGPLDALALRRAAGLEAPIEAVCPQAFALPAAPAVAAAAEGRGVDREAIRAAHAAMAAAHEIVLVEGAGGLLVPLDPETTMAELARELGLPVLLVARGALGTINHTLLSLEAARRRGLPVIGVVVSHVDGPLSDADARNLDWLRLHLGEQLLGELPPLAPEAEVPRDAIDVGGILRALG